MSDLDSSNAIAAGKAPDAKGARKTTRAKAGAKSSAKGSKKSTRASWSKAGEGKTETAAERRQSARSKAAESLRDAFLEMLNDPAEMEKPSRYKKKWNPLAGLARSGTTGRVYRGMNQWRALVQGFTDPRFYTFNAAKEAGHPVKGDGSAKGKGVPMLAPFLPKGKRDGAAPEDDSASPAESEKRAAPRAGEPAPTEETRTSRGPIFIPFYAFNAQFCEGVPPLPLVVTSQEDRVERLYRIVEAMGATGLKIAHGGTSAHYMPSTDTIAMPPKSAFGTLEDWLGTLAHEVGHATGHAKRCDRDFEKVFASMEYRSLEELVAEPYAVFLSGEVGIDVSEECLKNHSAYVSSWRKALTEKAELWVDSLNAAQKAIDYTLEMERRHMATRLDNPIRTKVLRDSLGLPPDPELEAAVERQAAGQATGQASAAPTAPEALAAPEASAASAPSATQSPAAPETPAAAPQAAVTPSPAPREALSAPAAAAAADESEVAMPSSRPLATALAAPLHQAVAARPAIQPLASGAPTPQPALAQEAPAAGPANAAAPREPATSASRQGPGKPERQLSLLR